MLLVFKKIKDGNISSYLFCELWEDRKKII